MDDFLPLSIPRFGNTTCSRDSRAPRLGTLHFVPTLPGAIKTRQASAVEKSIGFEDFPSYKWFNDVFSIEDDEILIYTS